MSGQLHAPAVLLPWKELPFEYTAEWTPELGDLK
jgi:hypothetical protein